VDRSLLQRKSGRPRALLIKSRVNTENERV
jgi:hypothetical protein